MKSQADLMGRLQQLNVQDRSWIMQQLSERERAQLLATLEAPEQAAEAVSAKAPQAPAVAPVEPKKNDGAKALARVEPRAMASLLRHEPAWIAALVIQGRDESWSKEVLDALPALLRSQVERACAQSFGEELTQAVVRQVLAHCQGEMATVSVFDRLVEKISASRSRRRLTLHL